MASKAVACEGDVVAQPGTTPFTGAASGTWTPPASLTLQSYAQLQVGGVKVVHAASGVFQFAGTTGSSPVTGASTVTLTAGSTILQGSSTKVLVHGDSQQDQYGNTLKVVSTRSLLSA